MGIPDGLKNGQKVPQVGGNSPVAPKPSGRVGDSGSNVTKPPTQTKIGGNFAGGGHKIP